jgi:hypothetical protein
VELEGTPDGAAGPVRLLAAYLERDGRVWIVRMKGPASVVSAETEAFRRFVASIREEF